MSGVSLAVACAIALPIALYLGHIGKGGALAVNLSNVGRAVPVFAVLALFMVTSLRNSGYWPTIIALVLFAVPPLLTNAYVGMREVDRAVVEAARAWGCRALSSSSGRAAARLPDDHDRAAVRRRPGRGHRVDRRDGRPRRSGRIITAGFNTYDTAQVFAGAVLVAGLALVVEGVLVGLDRLLSPLRRRRPA